MRKALAIVIAAFAGSTLAAAPDWQAIGENANGNKIYVDKGSVKAPATRRRSSSAPSSRPRSTR